jgi:molybdopterin synthase catalytic subunit
MSEMSDRIALETKPLDISAAVGINDPASGAVAMFLGTTRKETNARGEILTALDYEAYAEMALAQMRDLAAEARRRWTISRIVLLHRVGRVEIGQPSVLIAVSTPHRAAAFEACRFLIDRLKSETTIWKKEIWSDGTSSWVGSG